MNELWSEPSGNGGPEDRPPWNPPEVLAPGAAAGRGAEPEAALELLADARAREQEAARHEALLERFERRLEGAGMAPAGARARTVDAASLFLFFLLEQERVPLRAVHERDLRIFLYRSLPEVTGSRFQDGAPWENDYRITLPALAAFFRMLEVEEELSCPWADPLLEDEEAFLERWYAYPGPVDDELAAWDEEAWDEEEDAEETPILEELTDRTLELLDWSEELEVDLWQRAMLPHDETADGRTWMAGLPPEEWDLDRELGRRWLLWREEAVAEGITDPGEVRERAIARQRTWEQTPHARLGGRTPLEALEDGEE